jgi:cysteine-rich repeat protein
MHLMRASWRVVVTAAALACADRQPFVLLTIEDPDSVATDFVELSVGLTAASRHPVHLARRSLPVTVTVTAADAGDKDLWVEARDADGWALGRGQATVRFASRGTPTGAVILKKGCLASADCDDALFCNGREVCDAGFCRSGESPCASVFACINTTCVELDGGTGACSVVVNHAACASGEYCSPTVGCVQGNGCHSSADCDDGKLCNGSEQCVNFICLGGQPPATEDGDPCTLDGCSETLGVFHLARQALDGDVCDPESPSRKICISAAGGCTQSTCADGFVDAGSTPPEACDDGPNNSDIWSATRHCNASCSGWAPYCGDGSIEPGQETCDDGDDRDTGNGCSATCQRNDHCGDQAVQSLYEQCDDGDVDECNGCRTDCRRGCICAAHGACLGSTWCSQGQCVDCTDSSHCGSSCGVCNGETPSCGGVAAGCVCDTTPGPRGSCVPGSYCNVTSCTACDDALHCGPECTACNVDTPVCAGVDVGCVASSCSGKRDFTPCWTVTMPDRSYDICIDGTCQSPGCGDSSCNPPGVGFARTDLDTNWRLPDGDQRHCYDDNGFVLASCPGAAGSVACGATNGCGQDAQYGWDVSHSQNERFVRGLDAPDEPVVFDNITNLMWQGCVGGMAGLSCSSGGGFFSLAWSDALSLCETLDWGGYRDWRLPDPSELDSIYDYGVVASSAAGAFDPAAFPGAPGESLWTNMTSMSNAAAAWSVRFLNANVLDDNKTTRHAVICVRRLPARGPPSTRFVRSVPVVGEPIVEDRATGLVWQGCQVGGCSAATSLDWRTALAACENLSWAGKSDWRLPSAPETHSILDMRLASPALNTTVFSIMAYSEWTSTTISPLPNYAVQVSFAYGDSSLVFGKTYPTSSARCVRDAP